MTMLDGQGEGDYEDDPSVQGHLVRSSGGPVHQQEKVVGYPEDKEQHRDDTAHLKEDLAEFEAESEEVVEHSDSGDLSSPPPISSGAARSGM